MKTKDGKEESILNYQLRRQREEAWLVAVAIKGEEEEGKWGRRLLLLPSGVGSTNRTAALGYAVLGCQKMFPSILAWNIRKNMETPCLKKMMMMLLLHRLHDSIELADDEFVGYILSASPKYIVN